MPYQGNAQIYVGSTLIWAPGGWPTPVYTLGTAAPVTVTAAGSTNTYGSWTQLVASTAHTTDILMIQIASLGTSSVGTAAVLSVGTGAAASEVELFAIPVGGQTNQATVTCVIPVPVHIASGTRLSARLQCETVSRAATVGLSYSAATTPPFSTAVDVMGVNLATSRGINMPTNDTYVQVDAASDRDYQGLILIPCCSGGTTNGETSTYTVGLGGSGSEVAFGSAPIITTTTEQVGVVPSYPPLIFMGHIPVGTRIAVKQSVGRAYRDVGVIGIRYP